MSQQTAPDEFEIYPMPMFASLEVPDVTAVAAWYVRALGFAVVFSGPPVVEGQPSIVHLRRKKYQDLLLVPRRGAVPAPPASLALAFEAAGEVDALALRAQAAPGLLASAVEPPVDTPWGTRDLRVIDPGGHRLVFTSPPGQPDPEIVARWQELFAAAPQKYRS